MWVPRWLDFSGILPTRLGNVLLCLLNALNTDGFNVDDIFHGVHLFFSFVFHESI